MVLKINYLIFFFILFILNKFLNKKTLYYSSGTKLERKGI